MSLRESLDSSLSSWDAFLAMTEFVWRFIDRLGRDDLYALLEEIRVERDGTPTNPAAWGDWQECVDWIRSGHAPRSGPTTNIVTIIGPAGQ